MSNNPTTSPAD
jgi:hypothetical protein